MTAAQVTQHAPDQFQTLMQHDRVYSGPPVWQIRTSPGEIAIVTRPYWKLGIAHFGLFAFLGIGLFVAAGRFDVHGDAYVARLCSLR